MDSSIFLIYSSRYLSRRPSSSLPFSSSLPSSHVCRYDKVANGKVLRMFTVSLTIKDQSRCWCPSSNNRCHIYPRKMQPIQRNTKGCSQCSFYKRKRRTEKINSILGGGGRRRGQERSKKKPTFFLSFFFLLVIYPMKKKEMGKKVRTHPICWQENPNEGLGKLEQEIQRGGGKKKQSSEQIIIIGILSILAGN